MPDTFSRSLPLSSNVQCNLFWDIFRFSRLRAHTHCWADSPTHKRHFGPATATVAAQRFRHQQHLKALKQERRSRKNVGGGCSTHLPFDPVHILEDHQASSVLGVSRRSWSKAKISIWKQCLSHPGSPCSVRRKYHLSLLNLHCMLSFFRTKNVNLIGAEQYHAFKNEKFFGTYVWGTPTLMIQDLDLIQQVRYPEMLWLLLFMLIICNRCLWKTSHILLTAKDHSPVKSLEPTLQLTGCGKSRCCPFLVMLGRMWGKVKKHMTLLQFFKACFYSRSAFSPIFTSGKLKHMKYLMDHITQKLVTRFCEAEAKGKVVLQKKVFPYKTIFLRKAIGNEKHTWKLLYGHSRLMCIWGWPRLSGQCWQGVRIYYKCCQYLQKGKDWFGKKKKRSIGICQIFTEYKIKHVCRPKLWHQHYLVAFLYWMLSISLYSNLKRPISLPKLSRQL